MISNLVGILHSFLELFHSFYVIFRVAVSNVLGAEVVHLEILWHLSRQLFKDLFGESYSIVAEFLELDKLHKISLCFSSLRVNHLHIVIIQFMHYVELSTSDSNNDHWNGKVVALYDKVDHFLTIVDLPIGQDEEDHIVCS